MTGKALWVGRSRGSSALCPCGTRSPCCSVPLGRRERPSRHCSAHGTHPSDTANQPLPKDHSLRHQGIGSCPQIGDITSLSVLWAGWGGSQFRAECEGSCAHQAGLYDMAFPFATQSGPPYPTTALPLVLGLYHFFLFCHLIVGVYQTGHFTSLVWCG